MDISDLRNKSTEELKVGLYDLLRTQFGLRMQHSTGQLGDNSALKKIRRDIARIQTVLTEKGKLK